MYRQIVEFRVTIALHSLLLYYLDIYNIITNKTDKVLYYIIKSDLIWIRRVLMTLIFSFIIELMSI